MKIHKPTSLYPYRYFEETIYYREGDRRPEIQDVIKKNNAEWILLTISRSGDAWDKSEQALRLELFWAHKKDYEKLYKFRTPLLYD